MTGYGLLTTSVEGSPLPLHSDHVGCVGFVTSRGRPVGTCFLVTLHDKEIPGLFHGYVVTARHVIYSEATGLLLPELGIRIREWEGNRIEEVEVPQWAEHPDDEIDIAVAPITVSGRFLIGSLSLNLHPHVLTKIKPVLGQDVFYVGLFAPEDRMGADGVPMVRSGTLGAVSQMIQPDGKGRPFEAHMIDCRSYGGFSGSPVYLQLGVPSNTRELSDDKKHWEQYAIEHRIQRRRYWTWLLGLLIIHYTDRSARGMVSNVGIGIVVPAEHIIYVISTNVRLEEMREDTRREANEKPGADVRAEKIAREAEAYTRDDFMNDLTKVTRPGGPPDQEE